MASAVVGLLGAGYGLAGGEDKAEGKELVKCTGINSCSGTGECAAAGALLIPPAECDRRAASATRLRTSTALLAFVLRGRCWSDS